MESLYYILKTSVLIVALVSFVLAMYRSYSLFRILFGGYSLKNFKKGRTEVFGTEIKSGKRTSSVFKGDSCIGYKYKIKKMMVNLYYKQTSSKPLHLWETVKDGSYFNEFIIPSEAGGYTIHPKNSKILEPLNLGKLLDKDSEIVYPGGNSDVNKNIRNSSLGKNKKQKMYSHKFNSPVMYEEDSVDQGDPITIIGGEMKNGKLYPEKIYLGEVKKLIKREALLTGTYLGTFLFLTYLFFYLSKYM